MKKVFYEGDHVRENGKVSHDTLHVDFETKKVKATYTLDVLGRKLDRTDESWQFPAHSLTSDLLDAFHARIADWLDDHESNLQFKS